MNGKNILVVEDEALIAHELCDALIELGHQPIGPAVNHSGAVALMNQHVIHLALVDIHLTGFKDGIDFAQHVRSSGHFPVLFLTANSDAATVERASKTRPAGFLMKPILREQLGIAITIALANWAHRYPSLSDADLNKGSVLFEDDALFVSDGWQHHKVLIDSIRFMKSDHVYVEIHTLQDRHVIRMTLAKLEATLNSRQFMRIHRSHIVNLQYVTRFDRLQVWVGEVSLGVGANYRDALMERLPIL